MARTAAHLLATARGRLRWAFDVAYSEDPERDGDALNRIDDLQRFLGPGASMRDDGGLAMDASVQPILAEARAATAGLLQLAKKIGFECRQTLDFSVPKDKMLKPTAPKLSPRLQALGLETFHDLGDLGVHFEGLQLRVSRSTAGKLRLHAAGPWRELLRLRLLMLLVAEGAENARRCPECGRAFWRVGRQKYCGRQCTNAAVFRAWQQTPKGQHRRRAAR